MKSSTQNGQSTQIKAIQIRDAYEAEQDENCEPAVSFSTPSTTRFKNALSSSPDTPKRRVQVLGGLLTPRTPRSSISTQREHNIYARARQLFSQSSAPSKLVGRETERQQLSELVRNAKISGKGSCTYISGPPGTGKSALVNEVLEEFKDDTTVKIAVISCVGIRSPTQIYERIMADFSLKSSKKASELQLRQMFTRKNSQSYVLVLDEVDSLVDVECEALYSIFEWALHPASSLTLIGIANALDLTDRFLPRLKSKGLKPELLPFLPYTASQISQIITDRLRSLLPINTNTTSDFVPCMHPAAIQLCGKKIASQTGDLRKAFSLVRKSIEQTEKDSNGQSHTSSSKHALIEITNPASATRPSPSPLKNQIQSAFTAETAPRATIAHVARLASSIFNNGTTSRLAGLNLQQKAVLCSIVNKETRRNSRDPFTTPTKSANKAPTVAELFSRYSSLCSRDDGILQPLKDTEFRDVVASLETLGLVHESGSRSTGLLTPTSSSRKGKTSNERQITSAVAEKEMRDSLVGPGTDLLRRLLDEF